MTTALKKFVETWKPFTFPSGRKSICYDKEYKVLDLKDLEEARTELRAVRKIIKTARQLVKNSYDDKWRDTTSPEDQFKPLEKALEALG